MEVCRSALLWHRYFGGGFPLPPSAGGLSPGFFCLQGLFHGKRAEHLCGRKRGYGRSISHYLLTPVFHDQANDIREQVMRYEQALSRAGLPTFPFAQSRC